MDFRGFTDSEMEAGDNNIIDRSTVKPQPGFFGEQWT
jgi:hypothetical protein